MSWTRPWFRFLPLVLLATQLLACSKEPATEVSLAPTVKVAAIQCSSDLGAVAANCKKLTELIRAAAASGAKFVVLPETAVTGYLSQDLKENWHVAGRPLERDFKGRDPAPYAEPVPGPSTSHFCSLAKELGIYLTIPLLERAADEPAASEALSTSPPETMSVRYFNTVCLASPAGELVAHYRKLNPWPYPEKSWATPGDRGIQFVDTEYGRVGLGICYDIHTVLEQYEPERLWALLYPIAWVDEEHPAEWFWHTLPARTAPFNHYVIGANWSVDKPHRWRGYGFSTILAPRGAVLATAKSLHGSEIVMAEIQRAK